MDYVVVDVTNTEPGYASDSKSMYSMLQPFWLKAGYVVTKHCHVSVIKMKDEHADNSGDAHGGGDVSQMNKYKISRDNLDHITNNGSYQSSTKRKLDHRSFWLEMK